MRDTIPEAGFVTDSKLEAPPFIKRVQNNRKEVFTQNYLFYKDKNRSTNYYYSGASLCLKISKIWLRV